MFQLVRDAKARLAACALGAVTSSPALRSTEGPLVLNCLSHRPASAGARLQDHQRAGQRDEGGPLAGGVCSVRLVCASVGSRLKV